MQQIPGVKMKTRTEQPIPPISFEEFMELNDLTLIEVHRLDGRKQLTKTFHIEDNNKHTASYGIGGLSIICWASTRKSAMRYFVKNISNTTISIHHKQQIKVPTLLRRKRLLIWI